MANCDCQDWQKVIHEHEELFQEHPSYGWIIAWLEITKEGLYHRPHNYGVQIKFCPFCGNKLK